MSNRVIQQSDVVQTEALEAYRERKLTTEEIALQFGISAATLTVWAKRAGMELRKRGRKKQERPTPRQLEIVRLSSLYKYEEVGRRFGMQKQSIHRIVKRWRSYANPRSAPFQPGDVLLWRNKRFTVIDANHTDGTLQDEHGKTYKNFVWNGGRMPKKIGVNQKYLKAQAAVA